MRRAHPAIPTLATVLGGMKPEEFLRRHWQKEPLVVRGAFPGFRGIVDLQSMCRLAARDDVRARLVVERPRRRRARWQLHEGPFELEPSALPPSHWTLLVQGVESQVPGGWELLRAFSFLPVARVDDLMVSYAAPGGSVGPHDDLYDVFLLQGPGLRRWRYARRYERAFLDDAPMRVLRDFSPEEDVVLEPGDMLYLPPRVAHWGTAVDGPCFTYSVGFLAPSHDALAQNFLAYLAQERGPAFALDVLYSDPDLKLPGDPWALDDAMVQKVKRILDGLTWTEDDVADFTGRLLTGPRPGTVFQARARPLDITAFARRAWGGSVRLALPTRALVRGRVLFMNGIAHPVAARDAARVRRLVAARELPLPASLHDALAELLCGFVNAGWATLAPRTAR